MRTVLDNANALLIGGASFVEEVCDRLGSDPARFTIVPGAVDTARFAQPTPDGLPSPHPGPARLLYHGRVDRRKGVLDFIEALAILREQGTPFAATISGIGPDVDPAKALADTHGFGPEAIRFTGYAEYETVPALYREADIFASPTYAEGFSNTILEAMAAGLAVVSCHAVGVSDCLRDGENGLLTMPGDVPAQAQALTRVIRDTALRRSLAAAGWRNAGGSIPGRPWAGRSWGSTRTWWAGGPRRTSPTTCPSTSPAASAPSRICCDPSPPGRRWSSTPPSAAPAACEIPDMPTALALSPHLDDAAFSAGGLLATLAEAGWRVVMATLFTQSVPAPEGFALACQLDKGLGPEVDYMALRRGEDDRAARALGIAPPLHLPFREAPHRGYGSAPELFPACGTTTASTPTSPRHWPT